MYARANRMQKGSNENTDAERFDAVGGESESVYEAIFRQMEDAVFLIDVKAVDDDYAFIFRRNNASHQQQSGFSEDEFRGQTPRELLGDEQGAAVAANYRRCAEQQETIEYNETLDLPGGTSYWRTKLTPITEHGRVTGIIGVARDVTEQKERKQKLQRVDRRFQTVLNTMSAAIFLKDTDGEYLLMNRAGRELLNMDDKNIVGLTDDDLFPPDVAEAARSDDRRVIENGDVIETEETIPTNAGDTVRLTRKSPVYDDDGEITAICGVSTDITDQKEQQKALEAAQEELRQIVDLVPDLIFAKNREGKYLLANEATAEAYGLTPGEVEGELEADIIPSADDSEEFRTDDVEVIESGEPRTIPEEELTTAGEERRIMETTKIPYQIPDSGEDAVLGYARDVTELKEYEQRLEDQRDNLEVINQVVRHDIRNELQLVLGYAEILREHVAEDDAEYIQQILNATRDALDITTTAREVTKVMLRSEADRTPVGVQHVLETQMDDVRANYERTIVSVAGAIPDVRVLADDMLESVFRNLLNNAIVHNDKELREVTVSATADDERIRIRVADNGPGIPDDHKEAVFGKEQKGLDSSGTGVGLYLVETLVTQYGGDVWIEDNDPDGAVFVVELPLAE